MRLDEEYVIDGSPRSNAARYINHSCEPNAKLKNLCQYIFISRVFVEKKNARYFGFVSYARKINKTFVSIDVLTKVFD